VKKYDHLATLQSLGHDFSADRRIAQGDWLETPDGVPKVAGAVISGLALFLTLVA